VKRLANIIGFSPEWQRARRYNYNWRDQDWEMPEQEYKFCNIHTGNRLVKLIDSDPNQLYCPTCGYHEKNTKMFADK
jgi:hypothetical protein